MSKATMKRYDAYKDSGVEWLGDIPEYWKISHLKRFCTKITDGAHTSPDLSSNDYPFLTVVNLNNGILDFENCLFTSYIDYDKLVRNGCQPKKYDVLYSKDGTISETVVIDEDRNFVVGSSFIIVRPNLKMSNSFYLCYFLTSAIMRYQARIYVKGASLPMISIFNIAKLISIIPPFSEQQTIANYLDTKTTRIDRKIDLLTQKATQYGKLKQSLINETVTRGLDKSVAMKDSGVEWIGEVPEHWGIKRHKDNFTFIADRCVNSSLKKVGLENIECKTGRFISTESEFDGDGVEFKENDILFGKLRPYLAKVYLSQFSGNAVGDIFVYRPKRNTAPNFAQYLMLSDIYIDVINSSTAGAKMPRVSSSFIANLPISTPPLPEQTAIADYLDTKTGHIDRIAETINTQIDKLKELRKTLINDVVTGKIKVA
jgi:restriction endonuclease S subunit